MSNRIKSNGSYPPPEMSSLRTERESSEPQFQSDNTNFAQPLLKKFGAAVNKSPGVTLLVALAAGVAIGVLVKRK